MIVKLDEHLQMNFRGETSEVGLYLAMAKRAEEEGHPEIALYLKQVAMDEAYHAAEVAEILGLVNSTKENLERMLAGETKAEKSKAEAALQAREENNLPAFFFFERASKDEGRHKAGLQAFLEKLK